MATITALYCEFEKALAVVDAQTYPRTGTGEKEYDAAIDKASDLAD
jgi:hypothetical protein